MGKKILIVVIIKYFRDIYIDYIKINESKILQPATIFSCIAGCSVFIAGHMAVSGLIFSIF